MLQKKTLVLCAALIAGTAFADDGEAKKDGWGKKAGYGEAVALSDTDKAELASMFEEALGSCCAAGTCAEEGGCATKVCEACETGEGECAPDAHEPSVGEKVVSYCAKSPEALAVVAPMIEKRFGSAEEGQRNFMIELLAWNESDLSVATSEKLYKAEPAAFAEDHVLAFAPRSEKFHDGLEKLAKKGRVLPAAYFALKGEKEGGKLAKQSRATLVKVAKQKKLSMDTLADQFVAATTLKKLGEPEYFKDVAVKVHDAVVAALDAGELEAARQMAIRAEFLAKQKDLGYLGQKMEAYCVARSKEVATADDIFTLIEHITPIM